MQRNVAPRASGKLDLTGALLYRKGVRGEAQARESGPRTRDLRPVYAGILVWMGVFGVIWLFG